MEERGRVEESTREKNGGVIEEDCWKLRSKFVVSISASRQSSQR